MPKDFDKALFAERLRIALHRRKMTQLELGEKTGISPKSVSKYVTEQAFPPMGALRRIADVLNVSVDWLMGRTEEEAGIYIEREEEAWADDVRFIRRGIQRMSDKERRVLMNVVRSYIEEIQEEEEEENRKGR